MEHFIGSVYEKKGIKGINSWLRKLYRDDFRADFLRLRKEIRMPNSAIGIVLSGHGEIFSEGRLIGAADENDLVLLKGGKYTISGSIEIFFICGNKVADADRTVDFDSVPVEPGAAGGTRKTLKLDRRTRADVHYIWVDRNNVKIPHYHRRLSEIYVVQSGDGKMLVAPHDIGVPIKELKYAIPLEKGTVVAVPPFKIHNTVGNFTSHVVGLPKFYDDIIFV